MALVACLGDNMTYEVLSYLSCREALGALSIASSRLRVRAHSKMLMTCRSRSNYALNALPLDAECGAVRALATGLGTRPWEHEECDRFPGTVYPVPPPRLDIVVCRKTGRAIEDERHPSHFARCLVTPPFVPGQADFQTDSRYEGA